MDPTDKELFNIVIIVMCGLGSILWGVLCWVAIRMHSRADAQSKKTESQGREFFTKLSDHDTRIALQGQAIITNQKFIDDKLKMIDDRLQASGRDYNDLDKKITDYLLKPKK